MRIMPTVGILAALLVVTQTPAQAQADFYKGKTVNVVVGARAVGSLSLSAQMASPHVTSPSGKHSPKTGVSLPAE